MDRNALIKALRDTAQSASNAIASNVSGPVDLITAGLRAGGLPINNPVGGSQWMAERGLTREVEMGVPRIVGETLGMAGPAVVAAKAPQIAAGLNKAGANLAAPKTLNSGYRGQRGAIDPDALGLKLNPDGTVSLLHGTTPEAADKIVATKVMRSAGEPNIYFTTADDAGYGTGALVKVDVDPKRLFLDDEFPGGRMDFSVNAPNKVFFVNKASRVK